MYAVLNFLCELIYGIDCGKVNVCCFKFSATAFQYKITTTFKI